MSTSGFFNFETKIPVNVPVPSRGLGRKHLCSLYFQVKNVSDLLAASFMALILLRDVNWRQKSLMYRTVKCRPALTELPALRGHLAALCWMRANDSEAETAFELGVTFLKLFIVQQFRTCSKENVKGLSVTALKKTQNHPPHPHTEMLQSVKLETFCRTPDKV